MSIITSVVLFIKYLLLKFARCKILVLDDCALSWSVCTVMLKFGTGAGAAAAASTDASTVPQQPATVTPTRPKEYTETNIQVH